MNIFYKLRKLFLIRKILKKNQLVNSWVETILTQSSKQNKGNYLPWLNYNLISFLQEKLNGKKFNVFEYGCGYSTLFWSKIATSVTSSELNEQWYKKIFSIITQQKIENVKINVVTKENFVESINANEVFDIIMIDSYSRNNCIKQALQHISENGIIILDNSDRAMYQKGIKYMLKNNFKLINFVGIAPMSIHNEKTTIFYRANNILEI